ncbi:MAG: hypothetical protein IID34_04835 [Planctomycetes bacterium]|nr:hypothetical protein [Planctomycetota bacterium]
MIFSTTIEFVVSAAILGLGLSVAAAYVLVRRSSAATEPSWWDRLDTPEGVRIRAHRRSFGMVMVVVVSTATFVGINALDPLSGPRQFGYYWLIVLFMVMWLCALALADIRQTLRVHRRWRVRHSGASLERYLQAHAPSSTTRRSSGDSQ